MKDQEARRIAQQIIQASSAEAVRLQLDHIKAHDEALYQCVRKVLKEYWSLANRSF